MTEERINAIEHAIAAAEHRGDRWTNQTIFAVVGGRYGDLSQYLGFQALAPEKVRLADGDSLLSRLGERCELSQERAFSGEILMSYHIFPTTCERLEVVFSHSFRESYGRSLTTWSRRIFPRYKTE